MSNTPNSNQQQPSDDSKKNIEELSDDLDFWNIDTSSANNDISTEELEEILEEANKQDLKTKAVQDTAAKAPNSEDNVNPLNQDDAEQVAEKDPETDLQDIEELLERAAAKITTDIENAAPTDELPIVATEANTESLAKATRTTSSTEKIATIFCYISIFGVLFFLVMYASEQHEFDTTKSYAEKLEKGDFATIESIETWWSEPEENNGNSNNKLIPSSTITLDPNSSSGVIRVVFYSYEEGLQGQLRPKGDPFTYQFADGKFLASGTNQITIHGTEGFHELAHYEFYRSQDENRWTIEIKEAESHQTEIKSFNLIATAPIEPIRK